MEQEADSTNEKIIFTIGRMNPPTPGHFILIEKLIEEAIKKGEKTVYLILSKTVDKKNPIPCKMDELKISKEEVLPLMIKKIKEIMISDIKLKKFKSDEEQEKITSDVEQEKITSDEEQENEEIIKKINEINVEIVCVSNEEKTPFGTLFTLIKKKQNGDVNKKIDLFLIIGADRSDMIKSIKKIFVNNENIMVDGKSLLREGMDDLIKKSSTKSELDITKIKPKEFSASFVRNLVANNKKEDFDYIYKKYLDDELTNKLYDSIKSELSSKKRKIEETYGGLYKIKKTIKNKKSKKRRTKRKFNKNKQKI